MGGLPGLPLLRCTSPLLLGGLRRWKNEEGGGGSLGWGVEGMQAPVWSIGLSPCFLQWLLPRITQEPELVNQEHNASRTVCNAQADELSPLPSIKMQNMS